jgi:cell division protein FtsQ
VFITVDKVSDYEMPVVLPIEQIEVKGELAFIDEKAVRAIVSDNISGGYFTLNLEHLHELLQKQPWIETVSLRRQWPAKLDVYIVEQKPVAYWNEDAYINDKGVVFRPLNIDKSLRIPAFYGPEGQHQTVWRFMNELYREIALLEFEVIRLSMDERRAWQLELRREMNGGDDTQAPVLQVKLGRFDTGKRLQRFVEVLPALASGRAVLDGGIEMIDMRYPNGFAVKTVPVTGRAAKTSKSDENAMKHVPVMVRKV